MNNLRELADEWDDRRWTRHAEDIGDQMATAIRAQADAVDRIRMGLSDDSIDAKWLFRPLSCGISDGDQTSQLRHFARSIAALYAPLLAENEQLRIDIAKLIAAMNQIAEIARGV